MQINCPWCGSRELTEFTYGGESHVNRPDPTASDEEWSQYLYCRQNRRGPQAEFWNHSYGCGAWFNVVRDTVTHEVLSAYAATEMRPAENQ